MVKNASRKPKRDDEISSIHYNDSREQPHTPQDTWTDLLTSDFKLKSNVRVISCRPKEQCDITESSNESQGSSGLAENYMVDKESLHTKSKTHGGKA
jgi:hypothetical protein